jgi:hypothetical protein
MLGLVTYQPSVKPKFSLRRIILIKGAKNPFKTYKNGLCNINKQQKISPCTSLHCGVVAGIVLTIL